MKVIPAIDIRGGKVVRFAQGAADKETVYSDSPLEAAERWAGFGVDMIHVVDLDGAMSGRLKNLAIVEKMARTIKPKIELGGGIRDEAAVKIVLESGIDKAVIGTKALDEAFIMKAGRKFRERLVAAIDTRDGLVRMNGWRSEAGLGIADLLDIIKRAGIGTVNYTDISRDGMLEGPNVAGLKEVLGLTTGLEIIAAGGVSSLDDLCSLKALEKDGLKGVIIGKALYERRIDLGEAIDICSQSG